MESEAEPAPVAPFVLVTGMSGFVGRNLAPLLRERGFGVFGAGRTPPSPSSPADQRLLPDPLSAPDHDFFACVEGAHHVVHLAAISQARGKSPDALHTANVVLTRRLAEAARDRTGGRFVFMSSVYAQAGPGTPDPVTEASPASPFGAYGQSKLAAEQALREIFANAPERLVILRPVSIYGEGMRGALGLLEKLAATPLPLPLAGLGGQRSYVHVSDLGDAVVMALDAPEMGGHTWLVAENETLDPAQIVVALRHTAGRPARIFSFTRPLVRILAGLGPPNRVFGPLVADASALQRLGWRPRHRASQGLAHSGQPQ